MTLAVPPTKPSAGVRCDQVLDLAPAALGGDREAPVLDEGAGVDEVLEVLPRGAPAGGVAAIDRLGPRRVLGQRPAAEDLVEVLALSHWRSRRRPASGIATERCVCLGRVRRSRRPCLTGTVSVGLRRTAITPSGTIPTVVLAGSCRASTALFVVAMSDSDREQVARRGP